MLWAPPTAAECRWRVKANFSPNLKPMCYHNFEPPRTHRDFNLGPRFRTLESGAGGMQALQVADRVFGCTPNANGLRTLECCAGGMQALKAADRVFGSTPNAKGFRVLNGCGVIQSDGIDINAIRKVGGAA